MKFKARESSNGSLPSIEAKPLNGEVAHDAIYQSIPFFVQIFYGGIATFDVYESLNVKKGQTSDAGIWVAFYEQGHIYNLNIVTAGWSIDPAYYGDNKTHFLIGWSADGYNSTGCFDLKCDGFVPVNYAPITPGDTLKGKSKISIKIFKSKDDGDWWLHFAHAGQKFAPVGYWPRSLFNSLAYYANYVSWGGFTGSLVGEPSPPMGNGHWPGQDSATFHDVQYVNSDGRGYPPVPAPGLQSRETHKDCYRVSKFMTDKFSYGGPGGCTN
ncbi:uncharacterized protein LOC119314777 [Triticum dicoccoides]|uniref:uncharacterized protein LOC119314777 n=1 Tax=Triticum dicoccoides TaxID=85692 RepID=UPI00189123BD|nr:uncharacterized protein LOC119314777 [Triticum dicoccoides]